MLLFWLLFVSLINLVKPGVIVRPAAVAAKAWTLAKLPGKGTGVIASRDIESGECLMNEKPSLALPTESWYTPTESQMSQKVNTELAKLSDEERVTFFNMFSLDHDEDERNKESFSDENSYLVSRALGIFRSNGYPLPGSEDKKFGVFPLISRINSACNPNAHFTYNVNTNRGYIHAVTDIKKGTEIVNNYYPLFRSQKNRRAYLHEHFNFICQCDVCSLPDELSAQSDARRENLYALEVETSELLATSRFEEAKQAISERLRLLRAEGIDTTATRLPCLVDAVVAKLQCASIYDVLTCMAEMKLSSTDSRIVSGIDRVVLAALARSSASASTGGDAGPSEDRSLLEIVQHAAFTARLCKGVESIEFEGLSRLEERVLALSEH